MRYDGARTATVVGGWSEDGALQPPAGAARSTSTATPSSRRCCAAAARSAWTATRTRAGPSPRRCSAPATGRRWRRRSPSADGCGARWPRATRSDEPLPEGVEQRLCDFAELVAQALANADAHEQLAASRARIVEAGDAERRRLERNLHDGAQQRLVALAVDLTLIGAKLEKDPPAARKTLTAAQDELAQGLDELRELARGIHPAVLTDRGLGPALRGAGQACAGAGRDHRAAGASGWPARSRRPRTTSSPRRSRTWPSTRAPRTSTVSVRRSNGRATVTVSDDGVGGADAAHGTGLRGLADRVEALDGHLDVDSPPERGTRISAEIPCP